MAINEDRGRVAAGVTCGMGTLAGVVAYVQLRTAECNWASAVGDLDMSHGFKEGTGPSGWLFLACTTLLTVSAVLLIDRLWIRILVFLPLWLVAVIVLFVVLAASNPCQKSREPPVAVICQGDDWKTLDRNPYTEDGRFKSRKECINYFRRLGWP